MLRANRLLCCSGKISFTVAAFFLPVDAHAFQGRFTVQQSITMTTFNDPYGRRADSVASSSPDGKYFYVLTTRGIIASNKVESTIWLFRAAAVRHFLFESSEQGAGPLPEAYARIAASPGMHAYGPSEPLISDVRWSEDSKKIFFIGQNSREQRRLYEVDVDRRQMHALTPPGYDVQQFDDAHGVIAYTANRAQASQPRVPWNPADSINADAGAVTGMGLEDILGFPEEGHAMGRNKVLADLWVGEGQDRFSQVPRSDSEGPFPDAEHSINVLSLSPDCRKVIRLLPIHEVPQSWSAYDPKPGFESWRIRPGDGFLISPTYWYRLREYELIDTKTGKARPLIQGPDGGSLAEEDLSAAIWSRDGRRVLVGNVGLPLEGVSPAERARRSAVCALASVDIPSLDVQCIAFTRDATLVIEPSNPKPLRVKAARFGASNDEVTVWLAWHGQWGQTEQYRRVGGEWKLVSATSGDRFTGAPMNSSPAAIRLALRQDLNTPPALWAEDPASGRSKLLWDPNPQLGRDDLGRAQIYEWKDPSGYPWRGILVLPPDFTRGKLYPLVIQTHGYLDFAFLSDGMYPTASGGRALASEGIVVLQTTERADHFDTGQEAHDENLGWEAAIDQLSKDGLIDRQRVGIAGFSRTCWQVEEALITHPNLFRAAVMADGMDNSYLTYRLFAEGRPSMAKEYEKIIGAEAFGDGWRTWFANAPGFHLDSVVTPLRIEAIGPSSILAEWETYASLRRDQKPVDLIYIPDGEHVLQKPLDRLASQQGTVDWFRFWLQDFEDPAAEKRAQYRRWRQLRDQMNHGKIDRGDEVPSPPQG
jgi:dipeptidyl aminopeptidase/acylaminoacyl peptidase